MQVMSLYQETFDHFRQNHPNFSGAKIIYAPIRRIDNSTLSEYISLAHQLKVRLHEKSLEWRPKVFRQAIRDLLGHFWFMKMTYSISGV